MFFPIGAAASYAVSYALRKWGLNIVASPLGPIVGVTVGSTAAAVCLAPFLLFRNRQRIVVDSTSLRLFAIAGLFMGLGQLGFFTALDLGQLITVAPLMSLQPLFVLFFAMVFLRAQEKVTLRIVIGTIIIVTGVTLLIVTQG